MKLNLITIALASLAVTACSSNPVPPAAQYSLPDYNQGDTSGSTGAMSSGEMAGRNGTVLNGKSGAMGADSSDGSGSVGVDTLLRDIQSKSIYFDFDQFAVKPEYEDVLLHKSKLLKSNSNVIVTLEGNADERGSSEYNLALGDKRANAVRKPLELLGVPANQIKAVSFGEEKPRLTCHEERCWSENRRVDFNGTLAP